MRRITGEKRIEKQRMEELRVVGVIESLRRRLVKSWLKWAERIEGELLTKTGDVLKVEGRRRRKRPQLR